MDAFIELLGVSAVLGLVVVLDVLAIRFGADSREPIGDDRSRPAWLVGSFPFWR